MTKGGLVIVLCAVLAVAGTATAGTARQSRRAAQIKALEVEMGVDFKSRRTLSGYSRQFEDCVAKTGITQELRTCAFREHQRLLGVMNQAYSKKMAALPAPRRRVLRKLQTSWLDRRAKFCSEVWPDPEGGTLEVIYMDECFLSSGIRRIAAIRAFH